MTPKALVTGAKGHTGSFLVKLLVDNGHDVVATDLPPRERSDLMKKETVFRNDLKYFDVEQFKGVTFIPADLTMKETLRPLFKDKKFDVIYHPASLYDYFAEYEILKKINVGGLKNLLEVIHEECTPFPRFLHWSTCGVYGQPKYKRDPKTKMPIPSDENAPYDPPNVYSKSKKEQELLLKDRAAQWKIPYTIIRPAPIYGPYQSYGMFHIYFMINKMGWMPLPHTYPRYKRLVMPMIHVEDLTRAALFLAQHDESIGEAYSVVEDPMLQEDWLEFVYTLLGIRYTNFALPWFGYKLIAKFIYANVLKENKKARRWGLRPKIDLSMADYITHQYLFSNAKLKKLGFTFKWDSITGTSDTIKWYIDHGWMEREVPTLLILPKEG